MNWDSTAPGAFSISAPSGTVTGTFQPTVTWGTSIGASSYDLLVATVSGCGSGITQTHNGVSGTSQQLSSLSNGTYYICVTAKDDAANATADSGAGTYSFVQNMICDTGTLDDTCEVSSAKTLSNGATISGTGNLVFKNGGSWSTAAGNTVTISLGGNLTIESGGSLNANLTSLTAVNVDIQAGGSINLDGKGYGANSGPGAGGNNTGCCIYYGGAGASHGGLGTNGASSTRGSVYDTYQTPSLYGSGGGQGPNSYVGGAGGGKIKLIVSGNLNVSGTISANGANGTGTSTNGGGGGSGGSIWIDASGTVSGSGTIRANGGLGGSASYSGAGGGGMIAIYAPNKFSGAITVLGGTGAAHGTYYQEIDNICDTGSLTSASCTLSNATPIGNGDSITGVAEITISAAVYSVVPSATMPSIDTTSNIILTSGGSITVGTVTAMSVADLTINSGASVTTTIGTLTATNVTVDGNFASNINESVLTNVTISASGTINADGRGYGANSGPGAGGNNTGCCTYYGGAGASHGGLGTNGASSTRGSVYDTYQTPSLYGSGGGHGPNSYVGGAGGGKIKLIVSGNLNVSGTISANGANGTGTSTNGGGGGSGGSIWINVSGSFILSGTTQAKGGLGGSASYSGAGGGGMIAIYAPTKVTGTLNVAGGTGAASGTIYQNIANLCDSGDVNTTCTLSNTTYLSQGQSFTGSGNLIITSNVISSTATDTISAIDFDGNITIESGGSLTLPSITSLNTTNLLVKSGGSFSANITTLTVTDFTIQSSGIFIGNISSLNTNDFTVSGSFTGNIIDSNIPGNLTVNTGASLSANGRGYGAQSGIAPGGVASGWSSSAGGGGHGGAGGAGTWGTIGAGGGTYGSITNPVTFGSGGGSDTYQNYPGGAGGGALKLVVGGTLTVSGSITANGMSDQGTSGQRGGGGAGGSIWLTVTNISGSGSITANGGIGNGVGGGGGGGRIALYSGNKFLGTVAINGGATSGAGGNGSYYQEITNICDSGDLDTTCTLSTSTAIGNNASITGSGNLIVSAPVYSVSPTGTIIEINLSGDIIIQSGGSISAGTISKISVDEITLDSGSTMSATISDLYARVFTLNASISGNILGSSIGSMTIASGVTINANGKGYGPGTGPSAGGVASGWSSSAGGGGHGGAGGNGSWGTIGAGGVANGSNMYPTTFGSGGGSDTYQGYAGGSGGGAIKLIVNDSLTINGTISANGTNDLGTSGQRGGGGAGGSIWLQASTISGSGTLSAKGGNGNGVGGGGGGGRIAMYYNTDTFTGTGTKDVAGGTGGNPGNAGTSYVSMLGNHHLAFVSSTNTFTGNNGSVSLLDTNCASLAAAANLPAVTWKAIVSSSSGAANSAGRIIVNGPVFNVHGDRLADDSSDFWDGTLDSAIKFSEQRSNVGSSYVWTGSTQLGANSADTCLDWTDATSVNFGSVGKADLTSGAWLDTTNIAESARDCSLTARVYCISQ